MSVIDRGAGVESASSGYCWHNGRVYGASCVLGIHGSSVTDAAQKQDYIERARELKTMLREDADERERHRQVTVDGGYLAI
ncbi:MAG: hypothetical protein WB697_12315 [Stellaceae bacterium]